MTKINIVLTTPKIAGILLILASVGLSLILKDNTYFSIGVPSGSTLLTADTIGARFGRNGDKQQTGKINNEGKK